MWKTSLILCSALFGCHSAMDDTSSMRSYIDDARLETTRHRDVSRAATTMQHMRDELERHRDGMMPMMTDIAMTMDGMTMHCDGHELDEMRAMHDDLETHLTQHFDVMAASTELASSQAEVERHSATMLSMIDDMAGAMANMHCR